MVDDWAHIGRGSVSLATITSTIFTLVTRLHLQTFIHRKDRYLSHGEKQEIAEWHDRIHARIDHFQDAAMKYYDDQATHYMQGDSLQVPFHDEVEFGEPDIPPLEAFQLLAGTQPETLKLALPSYFPPEYLDSLVLHALREQELQLQRGQANDTLQAI